MTAKKKPTPAKAVKEQEEKEKEKNPRRVVVEEVAEETPEKKPKEKADEKNVPAPEKEKEKKEKKKEDTPTSKIEESIEKKVRQRVSIKQVLMIAIPTAVIVGALTGGILFYVSKNKASSFEKKVTSTTTPTAASTSTPAPVLERSDLQVKVLNGSGVKGAAGVAEAFLEGLGYEDIETGNASLYDYEETEISIKEDKDEYLDMIIEDLSDEYEVATESSVLDEDSDFDVEITIGKS